MITVASRSHSAGLCNGWIIRQYSAGIQLGLGVISNMADQCSEWVCECSFVIIVEIKCNGTCQDLKY